MLTADTNDSGAVVSPDGRSVAFVSNQSGRDEVYVARWPGLEKRTAVSSNGGTVPRWSHDSTELFFRQGPAVMAAPISGALQTGMPRQLFSGNYFGASRDASYDVAADGRFLMVKSDERAQLTQITVLQNWIRNP